MMRVLVADDDPVTREAVEACLTDEGFRVITAADGQQALQLYQEHQPALVCLDIMMPHLDGFEVCRRIRQKDAATPILFLSAKNEEIDVVVGLELGADDFVRKPFGKRELLARVRVALRRQARIESTDQSFLFGHLKVSVRELRAVSERGEEIDLSPREMSMLSLLYQCAEQVVHRDQLLDHCWGMDYFPESRTLDQHIAKLRKKVERDPSTPQWIETVRGVGYRYRPPS